MEKLIKPDKKYVKKSIWVSFLSLLSILSMIGALAHLIAYTEGNDSDVILFIWLYTAAAFAFSWVTSITIIILWIKNLEYIILEDRVTIHKGIITKIQKNIPLRAVTDFILVRSLLDRFLGIGTIKIQTAGQSPSSTGFEGKLAGLLEYQALHETLRQRIGKLHPSTKSISADEPVQVTNESILKQILAELKEIKKNTASSD